RLVKTRSRSASIGTSASSRGVGNLGQRGLALDRRRAAAADHRSGRRRRAGPERIQQRLGRRSIEVLVEIVVDLQDRRVDTGAEAFDLDQAERSVLSRAAN